MARKQSVSLFRLNQLFLSLTMGRHYVMTKESIGICSGTDPIFTSIRAQTTFNSF